jgi:hypothetical protein
VPVPIAWEWGCHGRFDVDASLVERRWGAWHPWKCSGGSALVRALGVEIVVVSVGAGADRMGMGLPWSVRSRAGGAKSVGALVRALGVCAGAAMGMWLPWSVADVGGYDDSRCKSKENHVELLKSTARCLLADRLQLM